MSESKNKQHVLLITRAPGIGKTTVIRRAADELKHKGCAAFTLKRSATMGNDATFA